MSEPAKVIDIASRMNNGKVKNMSSIITINNSLEECTKIEFIVPSGYDVKMELVKKETKIDFGSIEDNYGYKLNKEETTTNVLSDEDPMDNSNMDFNRLFGEKIEYFYNKTGTINKLEHRIIKRRAVDNREVSEMMLKLNKLFKLQIKFLIEGLTLVLFSLVGFMVFFRSGSYFLHPSLYMVTLIMGLGWSLTALWSIKTNKDDLRNE